jgi:hypothetical protein
MTIENEKKEKCAEELNGIDYLGVLFYLLIKFKLAFRANRVRKFDFFNL